MADKKITQLPVATTAANTDLLLIVNDPVGSPVNKKIEIGDLFGETAQTVVTTLDLRASSNATIGGSFVKVTPTNTFEVAGLADFNHNRIRIRTSSTPANSNNTLVAWPIGTIAWDVNYLYIAVSSSQIARIAANTSW
jgi:hypothetical protein